MCYNFLGDIMQEVVYEKLEELIKTFDESQLVDDVKKLKAKALEDKKLVSLLEEYHEKIDIYRDYELIELKRKILDNPNFSLYKNKEQKLYYLVLEINSRLNKIIKEKSCSNENN